MRILLTGAGGQLGRAMSRVLRERHEVVPTTLGECDVRDGGAVREQVAAARPGAIVNCAAYTDVDGAEDDPVEALRVNALAVRSLAAEAAARGAALVHFSTDFVFDGAAGRPYTEDDVPDPQSTYACSKLIGEWFAREVPRHFVLRVESLFGAPAAEPGARRTSIDRIVDSLLAGTETVVFVDRTVSPSYTEDVSRVTRALLEGGSPAGLYHCVNSGHCTWYELAVEAAALLGVPQPKLRAVQVAEVPMKANRPRYCALSNEKLAAAGHAMPAWQDALARYLRLRAGAHR